MSAFFKVLRHHWPIAIVFGLCGLVFALDSLDLEVTERFLDGWLMVPAEVTAAWRALLDGDWSQAQLATLATLLSHAFLHGGAEHIAMNLLLIWVFGSLVLRELGPSWFLVTFVLTAITGGIGQVLLEPGSPIPTLGASGALMGLEGIYVAMALRWRLPKPDVWPIAEPIAPERLIILAVIGLVMDVSGIVGQTQGIAYGAHLGGFLGGAILGATIIPRPKHAHYTDLQNM